MPRRNAYILVLAVVAALTCSARAWRHGQMLRFAANEIRFRYLEPVDEEELFRGALDGMMSRLDEYSSYISPEMLAEFEENLGQRFGGIGVEILLDPETKELTVASPLVGSPAYEAGMRAGDKILRIDGESTQGMSLADAAERLRGEPGEAVVLSVLHYGEEDAEEIRVVRAIVHVDTVLGDTRNADGSWNYFLARPGCEAIGYLRINSFSDNTLDELRRAVQWLLDHEMKGLVLDLRNNPGGLLASAVAVCDLFIDGGEIVSTRGRNGRIRQLFTARAEGTLPEFPMAVLVNQYTASAGEIVAACLQDHHRAVIVGQRTFGKGTVQELVAMPAENGVLKLTMASYWRPSNKNIHRGPGADEEDDWGVQPDSGYAVKINASELAELLRIRAERDRVQLDATPQGESPAIPIPEIDDPQLQKAIEYIEQAAGRARQTAKKAAA